MQLIDSPFVVAWFAISIRWMYFLGLVISLLMGGKFTCPAKYFPASGNLKL